MNALFLPSLMGLLFQAAGALLMASLCLVLYRTTPSSALRFWSAAWVALFVALASLWCGIYFPGARLAGRFLYVLGECLFGYLLWTGCRAYTRVMAPARREIWLLVPAVLVAASLPAASGPDFRVFFAAHALIYGYLFLLSWRVMWRASVPQRSLPGLRVMQVALACLTIVFFHYTPAFTIAALRHVSLDYLQYAPFVELFVEVMLTFGMVMVVTGDVQNELEAANRELGQARDRFATMAQTDQLTSALNRHVFHTLVQSRQRRETAGFEGCIAMVDIDDLKPLNDRYGHPSGDAAIRAVARAVRSCIRADDLLFRWGGDEFLVVLFGMTDAETAARFQDLNDRLRQTELPGLVAPTDLTATVGFASFSEWTSFEDVIATADAMMYGAKKRQLVT